MEENQLKNKVIRGWAKGGYHHSEETKERISKSLKGRKPPPFTEEHRRNIGKTSKGRKHSEGARLKMSVAHKGKPSGMLGKKHSREYIENRSGENSYLWRGGKSFEPYTTDWTRTLRRSIRERDNYTCQLCGELQSDRAFDVHHIDYNKENCDPKNLITLCRSCNVKVNQNRDFWEDYFYGRT